MIDFFVSIKNTLQLEIGKVFVWINLYNYSENDLKLNETLVIFVFVGLY